MVELLFMMLILKLPILYLVGVCYWAVKAEPEPRPLEGARVPVPAPGPRTPPRYRPPRPGSHGGPLRREERRARPAGVRPGR